MRRAAALFVCAFIIFSFIPTSSAFPHLWAQKKAPQLCTAHPQHHYDGHGSPVQDA